MVSYEDRTKLYAADETIQAKKWVDKTPFIPMKEGWKIKPIYPFAGAVARFLVLLPNGSQKSIYLDCYDHLGYHGSPYWEVYPVNDNNQRCDIDNVEELIRLIESPN